jgi:hypothetical protein
MPSGGKYLEVMMRLLKKWQYKIETCTRREQLLLFLTDTRLLKFMEIMHKMKCVINTSSYPMHMFKELHNKLLAINKLCCRTFGATFILYAGQASKFTFISSQLASLDKKCKMA